MARTTQPIAQPVPTLTPDALRQLIHEVLAEREKKTRTDDLEALTIKAFRRAGFGEVKPKIDTRTYNLWIADGFKVKTGEKSVRVRNLRLFHRSQVEAISEKEKAALLEEREARRTADKLPPVTPIPAKPSKARPVATAQPQA